MNSENNQTTEEHKIGPELTKKERREIKRLEKEEQINQGRKKRASLKFIKWLITLLIIVGAGFFAIKAINKQKGNLPGEFYPEQSKIHIQSGQAHPPYSSNPPSSGWHWPSPAQTGIYDQELPDEQLIHNLEHSHVWISFRPDLVDQDTIEKLADIAKDFGDKIIMTPRSKNDSPIALAAWEYLLKLDSFDEKTITDFIRGHQGKSGPENPPDHGFRDFRK